ncbi:MAG: tautomerase family protein [Myxococcales bacterium]
MPVITIKAKRGRDPEKIDRLLAEVRRATSEILEVKPEKVFVVYEELDAGIYWDGSPNRPPKAS